MSPGNILKCIARNIPLLQKRKATLSQYSHSEDIDVCCLQEVKTSDRYAKFSGYTYKRTWHLHRELYSKVIDNHRYTCAEYLNIKYFFHIVNVYNQHDSEMVLKNLTV